MRSPDRQQVTSWLSAASNGDSAARERLWALVYDELRMMAGRQLADDALRRHMRPTTLVHEVYLRMLGDKPVDWANRRHFFAAAAEAMRRIRVDDARNRRRHKRGGGRAAQPLAEEPADAGGFDADPAELLGVSEALEKLRAVDPMKADVVNLRYFAGLSVDETAGVLGVSPRTVDGEWRFAKAWLRRELGGE